MGNDHSSNGQGGPTVPTWWVYTGSGRPRGGQPGRALPAPPPWRRFNGSPVQQPPPAEGTDADRRLGTGAGPAVQPDPREADMTNAALLLRRPLLVTGAPGTGKSTLAYRVARELGLGRVLQWPITSRSTLQSGLYGYDAIGRAQATSARDPDTRIGNFIRLGPLGTALLAFDAPRVLLIDELDKSDIDLPNDLLHVFEDGEFSIPELVRLRDREPDVTVFTDDPDRTVTVIDGQVRCREFPFVVVTSNGEREFPAAFLRRCVQLDMPPFHEEQLAAIVAAHFTGDSRHRDLVRAFAERGRNGNLAADQLLNAVFLLSAEGFAADESWPRLEDALWRSLGTGT
ncbi:MAG TPA: MoxR family ATPase [Trebonia sp.]|jgi:MoxR-like ATPase|nr:MoxR family ATPase [Trebonia sp.]